MKIKTFTFNPFQENTYILYDKTKECIIVDPGCYTKKEKETIKEFILTNKLNPIKLINTHCHIDHILGNHFTSKLWNLDLYIHKDDLPLLENAKEISKTYGFDAYESSPNPKYFLKEGEVLIFGETKLKVLFTPGHAPGHICLHNEEQNIIIGGDLIFREGIGRFDLPGGDYNVLIQSIKEKILPLAEETQIFCGHGPTTNIGYEKKNNPFLKEQLS